MTESLGQAQIEVTANLTDWQRALIEIKQDWDETFKSLDERIQDTREEVIDFVKDTGRALLFGGATFAINDIKNGLRNMALEADKASISTRVFVSTIKSAGLDVSEADKLVDDLSKRFRVMPEAVKDSIAIMARLGLGLGDIEKALVTAGSSAVIAGADIGDSFGRAAIAFTAGRSELLDSLGIVVNASEAWKTYGEKVGKATTQLTALEKAQAYITAANKESTNEIAIASTAFEGLTGKTSELDNATQQLRKNIGDQLLPVVTTLTEKQLEFTNALSKTVSDSSQLGTIIGGLTGALSGLTVVAGSAALKTAIASIGSLPSLLAAAGAGFKVFAPGGFVIATLVGLGAVIGNLIGDINKITEATKKSEEAWYQYEQQAGVSGAAARFASAKQSLGALQAEREALEKEAARIARGRPKPDMTEAQRTQQLLSDSGFSDRYKSLIVEITKATQRLAAAEQNLAEAQAERAKTQNATARDTTAQLQSIEDQIRGLMRLGAAGQTVTRQLEPLYEAYKRAGGDVKALKVEMELFSNELERNADAAKKAETAASKLAAEQKRVAEEATRLRAAQTAFASGLNQEDNLRNLGNQIQGLSSRELRSKFESIEAEKALAVARVAGAKSFEELTAATVAHENASQRLAVVQAEINKRVADGQRVMSRLSEVTLEGAGSATTLAAGFAAATPDFARTVATVERSQGAFTSLGDALSKLYATNTRVSAEFFDYLIKRFGALQEAVESLDGLPELERILGEPISETGIQTALDGIIDSLESFDADTLIETLESLGKATVNPALLEQIQALIDKFKKLREYMNLPSFGMDAGSRASPNNQLNALSQLVTTQIEKPTEQGLNDLLNRAYALTTAFDVTSDEAKKLAGFIVQLEEALKNLATARRTSSGEEDTALLQLENKERLANAEAAKAQAAAEEARLALRDAQAAGEDVAILELENKERLANAEATRLQKEAEAARQALRDAQAQQEDIALLQLENRERLANAAAIKAQRDAEEALQLLRAANAGQEDATLTDIENKERLAAKALEEAQEALRLAREAQATAEEATLTDLENRERLAAKALEEAQEALRLAREAQSTVENTALIDFENRERLAAKALEEAQEALRLARDAQSTVEDTNLADFENKERLAAKALEEAQEALRVAREAQATIEDANLIDLENRERLAAKALEEAEEALRVAQDARNAAEDAALMDLSNKERLEQLRLEAEEIERINRALIDRQNLTFTGSDTGRAALSGSVRVQRAAINGEQLSAEDLSFILADIEKALSLPDSMTGLNAETRRVLEGVVSNIQNQLKVLNEAREDLRNAGAGGGAASTLAAQSQANQLYISQQEDLRNSITDSNTALRSSQMLYEAGEITLEQYNARLEEQAKELDKIASNEKNLLSVQAAAARQAADIRNGVLATSKPSELNDTPKPLEKPDALNNLPSKYAEIRAELSLLNTEYNAGVINTNQYTKALEQQNTELQALIDSGKLDNTQRREAQTIIANNNKVLLDLTKLTKEQRLALEELSTAEEIRERIRAGQNAQEIKEYNQLISTILGAVDATKKLVSVLSDLSSGASASKIISGVSDLASSIASLVPGGAAVGQVIGVVGDVVGGLVDFFTAPQREAENLKNQVKGLAKEFKFFGEELAVTKTQSRGWLGDLLLGQSTVLDTELTAINTRIASSLENAVSSGVTNGFNAALETGDWNKFLESMNLELRNYLVKSFVNAWLESEEVKAALKEPLADALAAAKTAGTEDDIAAAEKLQVAYANLSEDLKPFYDILKPIYDSMTPIKDTNQPMQDVLNRPGVAVAVGGFAQAAVISQFEASITYFGGHITRFGEAVTRVEGYYGRLMTQGIRVVTETMPNSSGLAADLRGV